MSTSRCSWLGQEPSSALRETGPSSTERTLSANFREHSVSLVFFSAGDTCGQGGKGTKSPWQLPVHPRGSPLENPLLLASEMLLLTCPSQASPVHPCLGQCLSQLDSLSPTAPVQGAAGNSHGRCRPQAAPMGTQSECQQLGVEDHRAGVERLPELEVLQEREGMGR